MPPPQSGPVNDVKKFYSDYLKSDNYKRRLTQQGYVAPQSVIDSRLMALNTVGTTNVRGGGNLYSRSKHSVNFDKMEQLKYNLNSTNTAAHEFSHVTGAIGFKGMTINDKNTLNTNELNLIDKVTRSKDPHYGMGQEVKADMDAFRYKLYRDKVYDTKTQKFDKSHLDKVKKEYMKDTTFKRLFEGVKDEDLIKLMNSIAYSPAQSTGGVSV